jgi:hypothetical protein
MPSSPNLSLLDLSENPFDIASTRGNFFTYNNNLYIVYVEQDKKIRIKTGLSATDIYDGSASADKFVIYDVYLDSNTLYVAGNYGNQGFYLTFDMTNSSRTSFTLIPSIDLISHIFVINSKVHYIHRTNTSIGLSVSSAETISTVTILSDLTAQKNAYVKDYLYDAGKLFLFVQQEDDTTSYLNLRVFYDASYNAISSFNNTNSILLKTVNKHTLFSSISLMNGLNCLLTIVEDSITDLSDVQQNSLYIHNMNNFISSSGEYSDYISLSGVSILALKNIEYQGLNHLFGFCYQESYENAKYLVVPLENNFSSSPPFTTKSSSMGYISTNNSVEILLFENKVYVYLETRPVETSVIGTTRAMISDFSYREIVNTIIDGFISDQSILNFSSGSVFDFKDPALVVDISCAIYFGQAILPLGQLDVSGPQVSIQNASPNMKFIFASISDEMKNTTLGLTNENFVVILKVVDASSGQVFTDVNLTVDFYLDTSGGSILTLRANDGTGYVNAGQGTYEGPVPINGVTKYKYTANLTKGNGDVAGILSTPSASSGSDPHITTIFGNKYDFHPSTRKNYTLFQSKDIKVNSHFTGFKSGVFYDKVTIELKNKEKLDIDFNKKKIKCQGCSKYLKVIEDQPLAIKYQNFTSDKSVGEFFDPKKLTKIEYKGKNPMEMFVDFKTRYVHFRFPDTLPPIHEMNGLIVKEATRLD